MNTKTLEKLKNTIAKHFSQDISSIHIGFNCEYNDEGYDFNGFSYVEVYGEDNKFLTPKDVAKWRNAMYNHFGLYSEDFGKDNGCGLEECPDDIIIRF